MKATRTFALTMGVSLAGLSVFGLDAFFSPLGVAIWLPYIAVVLVSLWLPHPWHVCSTAAYCSVLTVAGLFLSPAGADFWLAGTNRLMAVLALWIAAVVGLKARRTKELEASNQALQREIQRREQLEAQFLRTQRLESIGVLTGGIAHDFNNLLTPILMSAKLLREEKPPEDRQQLLETLQASAERAAELVRKLLAFSGGISGERTSVPLLEVVTEIKEIVQHTFPKRIQIRTELAGDLPPVLADATQLSQVLMNLCVNARDAMPSGGTLSVALDEVTVDDEYVRAHPDARPGAFLRLTVADTGCGMPPEVLDQAFDPFFTTKMQGQGTGLGLSTALGIVRSHGGFLQVDSALGRGSRFSIYLPAQSQNAGKPEVSQKAVARRGNGEVILVVDDHLSTLQTVKAVLESAGYRVLTAQGGTDALDIYERNRAEVHVVLLDMMMPDLDGLAVMTKLRQRDLHLRIIAGSGLHLTGRMAEILAAHQVAFLPKPYSDERLLAALAKMLQAP